jgi:hypothetical protein
MTCEAFVALCQTMLRGKDMALLSKLSLDPNPDRVGEEAKGPSYVHGVPPCGCKFIDNWREWERTLRLSLAKHRASKIPNYPTEIIDPPFFPVEANQAAARALAQDISPLDGELVIDRARWNAIENLAGTDYFSRDNVFAYYLKLLLLERRQAFNVEKGFAEYKSLYAYIIESAQHSLGEP